MPTDVCAILHSSTDTLGTFSEICRQRGLGVKTIIAPSATERDWALALAAQTLFVMGGAMGVYEAEKYAFLKTELSVLQKRIAANAPTIGVCLGAQLLAAATGSKVYASPQQEFGWFPVEPTEHGKSNALLGASTVDWSQPVFHWHQDTFDAPRGATHLLKSKRCEQQAFCLTEKIYGVQFHIEIEPNELPDWLASEPDLRYGCVDGIQSKEDLLTHGKRHAASARSLAEGFLSRFFDSPP